METGKRRGGGEVEVEMKFIVEVSKRFLRSDVFRRKETTPTSPLPGNSLFFPPSPFPIVSSYPAKKSNQFALPLPLFLTSFPLLPSLSPHLFVRGRLVFVFWAPLRNNEFFFAPAFNHSFLSFSLVIQVYL